MKNITPPKAEPMPSKHALAVLDQPAPTDFKQLRITNKVRRAIEALVSGDCKQIKQAAEKAGIARESLTRALDKPHVIAYLHARTRRRLEILAARAGATKGELLDSENEMVRDRASSFVLGLAGIQPETSPSVSVNLEVRAGFVIDLRPEPGEIIDGLPVQTISPTP